MSRKTTVDSAPATPNQPLNRPLTIDNLAPLLAAIHSSDTEVGRGLSLTTAVQLSRSWIRRRHKALGWDVIAEPFRNVGYPHANAKNVRQAFDTEDTALVRDLAQTAGGKLFVAQLDAIIAGQATVAGSLSHEPASSKPTLATVASSAQSMDPLVREKSSTRSRGVEPESIKPIAKEAVFGADELPTREPLSADAPRPVIMPRLE